MKILPRESTKTKQRGGVKRDKRAPNPTKRDRDLVKMGEGR